MRINVIISLLLGQSIGSLLFGGAGAIKPGVEQQLRAQYAITRVGANGVVLQTGKVLIVQLDGIKAHPASFNPGYYPNEFKKDGKKVTQSIIGTVGRMPVGGPAAIPRLQVGDQVYLTGIEVKDKDIVFSVQSCGVCNPAVPNGFPLRAAVAFQFPKGYLETADYDAIQGVIERVFAIDTSPPPPPPPTPEQLPPQELQQPPQEQPQHPPPQQQPVAINLGDTIDQVVAAMGQPDRAAKVSNKDIYFYKDMKITFVDGKVSDIQ